jgi:hypothetical protein
MQAATAPEHVTLNFAGQQLKLPLPIAQQAGTLKQLLEFNRKYGAQNYNFTLALEELPEDIRNNPTVQEQLLIRLRQIFFDEAFFVPEDPATLLNLLALMQRLELTKSPYLENIATRYFSLLPFGELPPQETLLWIFTHQPIPVARFLKQLSNRLHQEDGFNTAIIRYYQELIRADQQIAYALQPHSYPFVHPDRVDRISPNLFLLNPLDNTRPLISDYMQAGLAVAIHRKSFLVPPPQWIENVEIKFPTQAVFIGRLVQLFPGLIKFVEDIAREVTEMFPPVDNRPVAGCLLAGPFLPICLDDWLFQRLRHKASIEILIYGSSPAVRERVFDLILGWFREYFDDQEGDVTTRYYEDSWVFVNPTQRVRLRPLLFNTAMAALSQQRLSHSQIGYDIHYGLLATPLFSLYWRRRESIIAWYGVRGEELIGAAYFGFAIKLIAPYAHILRESAIHIFEDGRPTAEVYYESTPNFTLIKGTPNLVLENAGKRPVLAVDYAGPRASPRLEAFPQDFLPGDRGSYGLITIFGGVSSIVETTPWETEVLFRRDFRDNMHVNFEVNALFANPSIRSGLNPGADTTIEGVMFTPRSFYHAHRDVGTDLLWGSPIELAAGPGSFGSYFWLRQCSFKRSPVYRFPRGIIPQEGHYRTFDALRGYVVENSRPPIADTFQLIDENVVKYPIPLRDADQGYIVFTELPQPADPRHLELLKPGKAEWPITVTAVLQLRTFGGQQRPVTPELYRESLQLNEEQIAALPLVTAEQLPALLYQADPQFRAQAEAYRENAATIQELKEDEEIDDENEEEPGYIPRLAEGEMENFKQVYRNRIAELTLDFEREAQQLPLYVRVTIDVMVDRWFFIDGANWLMPFDELFNNQFNCSIRIDSADENGEERRYPYIMRGYKVYP